MFSSISDTGDSEENKSQFSQNKSRTYDLLVTSPDALLLSYRRLVGAKAISVVLANTLTCLPCSVCVVCCETAATVMARLTLGLHVTSL